MDTKTIKLGILASSILLASSLSIPTYADEGRHDHEWNSENRIEHFQKRLDELHSQLNLNSNQDAAWQTYAHKTISLETPQHQDWKTMAKLPAPERLDKVIANKTEHLKNLQEYSIALKEFYSKLTPDQKTIFDLSTQHHWNGGQAQVMRHHDHKNN